MRESIVFKVTYHLWQFQAKACNQIENLLDMRHTGF